MRQKWIAGLWMILILLAGAAAGAEQGPVTGEEILSLAGRLETMAKQGVVLNDPAAEESAAEDGYIFQYDFGAVYADRTEWTEETRVNALVLMDSEVPGPRGISVDWTVNDVMKAVPCGNMEMYGTYEAAVLYLETEESGFRYGRAERDGQRLKAMEYGEVDYQAGSRVTLVLEISGDGVEAVRVEGLNEPFSREAGEELLAELEELSGRYAYSRVPRSLVGTELTMFWEGDLDFTSLSYQTAVPEMFGDNVEDVLIDNEDGTWLRRVDGDGFSAVFACDSAGGNAVIRSYEILSPDLEGPRGVRLGDLFHDDFTRFRSGEGALDETGETETLYGTVGQAPYGLAEYGNGEEMTLRYVTPTLSGPEVELILRYRDTVLSEIILHTLEEEAVHAD